MIAKTSLQGRLLTMELDNLRILLSEAALFSQPDREPSIFSIGGRGYYENPTTELLAYFLDPAQTHGLGACFLDALLGCLKTAENLTARLRETPRREVTTHNNN